MPKHEPSPAAQALAAEWWRVEEMGKKWNFGRLFCQPTDPSTKWGVVLWCGDIKAPVPRSFTGPTPAAAIIAAHEAWQKEQGK